MTLANTFAEAYASWLASVSQCCAPLGTCFQQQDGAQQNTGYKNPEISVVRDQPTLVQAPFLAYEYENGRFDPSMGPSAKARVRKSFSSTRTSLSVRRRLRSGSATRLQISAPTNFRHVASESFHFPSFEPQIVQPRRASFRPLQLSIYQPENVLSPILHHFEPEVSGLDRVVTPPPPARVRGGSDADSHRSGSGRAMMHERSYSSMSFHVPRRGQPGDSPKFTTPPQRQNASSPPPPQIPPKSRARAFTSPETEMLAERIASAMLEKEKLQELIDEVVERQSIYLGGSSRPSTAHSMAFSTMTGLEPMPAIPAFPPTAPSFAERLTSSTANLDRPNTAPMRSPQYYNESPAPAIPSPAIYSPSRRTPTRITVDDRPLQPPLPLVLRPPLRKKKSFSRVSTWLFPAGEQVPVDFTSITNRPRPVRGDEGFYQCVVSPSSSSPRRDSASSQSASSWETEDDDERTMPTTWSPGSSPAPKTPIVTTADIPDSSLQVAPLRLRTPTKAGETRSTACPRRESVGVAF